MFPDVVPIHQENVASTIDDVMKRFVNGELHLDPETQASPIGSTGKKLVGQTSNDLDIALDFNSLQEKWSLP